MPTSLTLAQRVNRLEVIIAQLVIELRRQRVVDIVSLDVQALVVELNFPR